MKRVFVFQDFKSQKFWSIDVQGIDIIVNYGKLGTDGQTQEKKFASSEEAEKAAEKLISEKTKKGYVETAEEAARSMKVEAKKYTLTYDEYENEGNLAEKIVKDKRLPELKQITVGCWSYECDDCGELVETLMANKEKLAHLEGLFWGDIDQEEQEISWIEQSDIAPLLDAMPLLKELKIKGTNGLSIGKAERLGWQKLEIISGGIPKSVVNEIIESKLPNLESLILYVGEDNYGFDGSIDDFKPLFSKERFPKLTTLGIVNACDEDAVVQMFIDSDILPQLETMDISAGVLTDKGGQILIDHADKLQHLKFINMRFNYLSDEMKKMLQKALPMKLDMNESQDEEDEEYYCPMITE